MSSKQKRPNGSGLDTRDRIGLELPPQSLWSMDDLWNDPYSDSRPPTQSELSAREAQIELSGRELSEADKANKMSAESIRGPEGFASTRIRSHYGNPLELPQRSDEERDKPLDLDSPEGRKDALSKMRQNANPLDPDGGMRCGASSLVGGVMYAKGKDGVKAMLDAIEADRLKAGIKDDGSFTDEKMAALKKKLEDPQAKLTQGDLDVASDKAYKHFQGQNKVPGSDGLKSENLQKFIGEHEDIKKMFKDNDMGLDSIDLSGDGRGEHLVLGIGHQGAGGVRDMIFDPQARQDKRNSGDFMSSADQDKLYWEERLKMKVQYDTAWALEGDAYLNAIDKLDSELKSKVHEKQYAYKPDSQLIEDTSDLVDYRKATDRAATADGMVDHDAQTRADPQGLLGR